MTHDLEKLIGAAGLKADLKEQQDNDETFQAYWGLAGDWSPEIRYTTVDQFTAALFLQAVGDQLWAFDRRQGPIYAYPIAGSTATKWTVVGRIRAGSSE